MRFDKLGLSHSVLQSAKELGYQEAFPIQAQAIPAILSGRDIMGIAPTGSGKTASFVMPILDKLQQQSFVRSRIIEVLVLVPTRELAVQIDEVFRHFSENLRRTVRSMSVFGGVPIQPQMKHLMGVQVLVATPGRLLELIEKNAVDITAIKQLVIDEADKLFQMGFEEEMQRILMQVPQHKQTMLFSATMTDEVASLKEQLSINPKVVNVIPETDELDQITQEAYLVSEETKGPFLRYLIKDQGLNRVLVFVSSQRTADNLVVKLKKNKIAAFAIHGSKSQGARMDSLGDFKSGKLQVLVATDLIGRGIDIEGLQTVINYELPRSPQDYVHRIGRTGRANENGRAISLITEADQAHFKVIQKKMKRNVEVTNTEEVNLHGF